MKNKFIMFFTYSLFFSVNGYCQFNTVLQKKDSHNHRHICPDYSRYLHHLAAPWPDRSVKSKERKNRSIWRIEYGRQTKNSGEYSQI